MRAKSCAGHEFQSFSELKPFLARKLCVRIKVFASWEPETIVHPHDRTRRDHAAETAQDYVEAIQQICSDQGRCRSRDLARRLQVSPVTVLKVLRRLERDGLVELEPYGPIRLTQTGTKLALECRRRHDAVYAFLVALGVSKKTAEIDTEGIEHHVSKETLRAMRRFTKSRGNEG